MFCWFVNTITYRGVPFLTRNVFFLHYVAQSKSTEILGCQWILNWLEICLFCFDVFFRSSQLSSNKNSFVCFFNAIPFYFGALISLMLLHRFRVARRKEKIVFFNPKKSLRSIKPVELHQEHFYSGCCPLQYHFNSTRLSIVFLLSFNLNVRVKTVILMFQLHSAPLRLLTLSHLQMHSKIAKMQSRAMEETAILSEPNKKQLKFRCSTSNE